MMILRFISCILIADSVLVTSPHFCAQVDKYVVCGCPRNNEKYMEQITKVLSQLSEERRWYNFKNFVKQQCRKDKGELFSNFVKSWYIAIDHVKKKADNVLPMLLLVMEIMKTDNLGYEPLIVLHNVLEEEISKMNGADTKLLGAYIAENFMNGWMLEKRWLSATTIFLQCMVKSENKFIEWEENIVNCMEYRIIFLLKLLNDVVSCNSFRELVIVLRNCCLYEIISLFVERMLQTEATPEICLKLIVVLPEMINWKGEQDLYMLSIELHELFESSVSIPKLFLARLKHHRQLVSCNRFSLICLLSLCNTTRYHSISMAELKQNVVKLQKHYNQLKRSAWIRDVMGDCDVETLKDNLDSIIEATVTDIKWCSVIGSALEQVAFMLLLDKCSSEIKFSDGRIVDDAYAISLGKSILISLARIDVASIGQLLEKILTILFTCVKHNSAFILIVFIYQAALLLLIVSTTPDTIVDIVSRQTVHVLNAWKSLQSWMDNICDLKESIAVSLVRALLPVIILRPQLIAIILNRMKKQVLCDSTVAIVLPILLLLLRSSTMRSAVKALQNMGVETKNTNVELSLEIVGILKRTFSQPANVKSILYRGIFEAASANQNLVYPTLDLLVTHLASLQQISRCTYIESSKSSTILLEPISDLIQAISLLMRLSIYSLRNTSTQVVCGEDAKVCQAMSELDKLIEFAIDQDVHDLQLDKLSDFSFSVTGRTNQCFASLMISLYDALIEHLWNEEAAEKVLALLRRREELNESLRNTVSGEDTTLLKVSDEDIDVNEECLQLLRENAFVWAMDWAQRISIDIYKRNIRASFTILSSFSSTMLLLYVGGNFVHEAASFELWNHKCTQAIMALSMAHFGHIERRSWKTRKCCVIDDSIHFAYKDFEERKVASDFIHQAFSLLTICRTLFKQVSNEKAQLKCAELIRDKTVLREVWHLYMHIERAGYCDIHYTNFLRAAATQIITETVRLLTSVNDITVETSAEMVAAACSASLSDARLITEMMSHIFVSSMDIGLVKLIDLCSRLAHIVLLLLSVYIDYSVAREPICALLTALYETLNVIVKLMLKVHKCSDISEWMAVTKLASLAHGSVLQIMENADENVGTLNPLDESSLTHNRKMVKSQKTKRFMLPMYDQGSFISWNSQLIDFIHAFKANLLLLCSALHDHRLDIQVRNNSIGVRDFRINTEKLRQRMEELGEEAENQEEIQNDQQKPIKKRARFGNE
ncbi:hypothetical protein DINM_002355 [Dirofilaria immitis]|nr:hypothetical protein [Dirofilaria immitis]